MNNGASSYHRFLNGDESGFEEIVNEYSKNLLYFINGFVSNMTIAEDLMEDVFVDLIVHKNRYGGKSSFKTYLFAVARNKAVDYIRKNKKEVTLTFEDSSDMEELITSIIKTEKNKAVAKALEGINREYKTVLMLIYFEDMSYEDISKILKKSNRQVKNIAYSARKSLKAILEKEGFHYEEV